MGEEKPLQRKQLQKKLTLVMIAVLLIFATLVGRLFFLQVVKAEEFQAKSADNRTRFLPLPARRGDILDRNGEVLATSQPVFSISLDSTGNDMDGVIAKLVALVGDPELTPDVIKEKLKSNYHIYEPTVVAQLPWGPEAMAVVSRIEEHRPELPGVTISEDPMRFYPWGSLAGHVLGQVGNITKDELQRYSEYQYGIQDWIGKTGLEKVAELDLRGQKGAHQVEVDAKNRLVRELVTIPPAPGNNVRLTLDTGLQRALEESLDRTIAEARAKNPKAGAGAGVVIDVNTGAILALASKPDIDPNDFVNGSFTKKQDYYNGPLKPSFNRAIQAAYPPGSSFKPITGMAALEAGKISPTDPPIYDSGAYWKQPYIKCWAAHGYVDFYRAFAVSCNTYFQYAGDLAGADWISKVAAEFGLGQATGSPDLPGEAAGILPTPAWKKEISAILVDRNYAEKRRQLNEKYDQLLAAATGDERQTLLKEKEQQSRLLEAQYRIDYKFETTWQPFDTYNISIGQGSSNYTILQLANYIAALANGGKRWQPYLIDQVTGPEGKLVRQAQPKLLNQVAVKPANMAEVRKGMLGVTRPGGTGYSLFRSFPAWATVAGKTGSSQTGRAGDRKNDDIHGLFVGFAPYDNPQIALAVIIEYGESGSGSAGKVARDVLAYYYGLDQQETP